MDRALTYEKTGWKTRIYTTVRGVEPTVAVSHMASSSTSSSPTVPAKTTFFFFKSTTTYTVVDSVGHRQSVEHHHQHHHLFVVFAIYTYRRVVGVVIRFANCCGST